MSQQQSTEEREILRSRYKILSDGEEGRRRREKILLDIRRNKREQILMMKRHEGMQDLPSYSDDLNERLLKYQRMVSGVFSADPSVQLRATTQFRMVLSLASERSETIDNVIAAGVVPRFVEFLNNNRYPNLQFEAAWALSSIASGTYEHTKVVIAHYAVPIFVQLMNSPIDDIREQATWALGIVAVASIQCRDYVLQCDALRPLLAQLYGNIELPRLRTIGWTLSNFLCQPLPFNQLKPAISALGFVLDVTDVGFLSDACWALYYLSDAPNVDMHSFIDAGHLLQKLVNLLNHPSPFVIDPAVRTIKNIANGNTHQRQAVIHCRALPLLANLLTQDYDNSIKKYACWTIANITAATKQQIQYVIEANLIPTMVNLARNAEFDIKQTVVFAISNATSGGTHDQIKYLVAHDCIETLCDILLCPDPITVLKSLDGLENILKAGEAEKYRGGVNEYTLVIEHVGGFKKIDNLQVHDNEINEKVLKILETY